MTLKLGEIKGENKNDGSKKNFKTLRKDEGIMCAETVGYRKLRVDFIKSSSVTHLKVPKGYCVLDLLKLYLHLQKILAKHVLLISSYFVYYPQLFWGLRRGSFQVLVVQLYFKPMFRVNSV